MVLNERHWREEMKEIDGKECVTYPLKKKISFFSFRVLGFWKSLTCIEKPQNLTDADSVIASFRV